MSENTKEQTAFQREKSTGMLAGRNVFGDATPSLSAALGLEQPRQKVAEEAPEPEVPFELEEGDI